MTESAVHKKRVTFEETLILLCGNEELQGIYRDTLLRVVSRGKYAHPYYMIRLYEYAAIKTTIWRAFYNRHSEKMINSYRKRIRNIAQEFLACDQAAVAMKAMNSVLELNANKTNQT